MADATVTIKVSTSEWALIQTALEAQLSNAEYFAKDNDTDFRIKSEMRVQAVATKDLLDKLK
jgi:hypothetical protein